MLSRWLCDAEGVQIKEIGSGFVLAAEIANDLAERVGARIEGRETRSSCLQLGHEL